MQKELRRDTAHELLNQLSAIVGHCDLLIEETKDESALKRLALIRDVAEKMAKRLTDYAQVRRKAG